MAEKGRPRDRAAAAKPRRDKSRPPRGSHRPSPTSPSHPDTPAPPEGPGGSLPGDGDPEGPVDVAAILAELVARVVAECAWAAVARQRVPFTVSRARDAILWVAEWRFLARDEGDPHPGGEPGGAPHPERAGAWSEDEEPQPCAEDSWMEGAVPVRVAPPSAGQGSRVTAEAGAPPASPVPVPALGVRLSRREVPCQEPPVPVKAPPACPGRAPGAATVPGVRLSRGEVPGAKPPAAAGAAPVCPGRVPGAVPVLPVPGPPRPGPPIAPRPPARGPPPARLPRPRPAPPGPPRPPAPRPAEPPERGGPRGSREDVRGVIGHDTPPPLSSRASLGSRPRRGTGAAPEGPSSTSGVSRRGPRRGSARLRPLPEVLDVSAEPERPRPRGTRRGPGVGAPRCRSPLQPPAGTAARPGAPQPRAPAV